MGEIADDMIDGACCSLCGVYFEEEHGYPVLCTDCYEDCTDDEKQGYSKTEHDEL
jgi:hypothetical protein